MHSWQGLANEQEVIVTIVGWLVFVILQKFNILYSNEKLYITHVHCLKERDSARTNKKGRTWAHSMCYAFIHIFRCDAIVCWKRKHSPISRESLALNSCLLTNNTFALWCHFYYYNYISLWFSCTIAHSFSLSFFLTVHSANFERCVSFGIMVLFVQWHWTWFIEIQKSPLPWFTDARIQNSMDKNIQRHKTVTEHSGTAKRIYFFCVSLLCLISHSSLIFLHFCVLVDFFFAFSSFSFHVGWVLLFHAQSAKSNGHVCVQKQELVFFSLSLSSFSFWIKN